MSGLQGGLRSGWMRWGRLGLDERAIEVRIVIACYKFVCFLVQVFGYENG